MQRHAQFLGPPIENAFEVHKMSQHSMHHTFAFFISLLLFIALKCTSFHVVSVALQLLRPRFHFDFLNRLLPTLLSSCGDSLFRFLNSFEQSYSSGQFAKCVHNNKSLFLSHGRMQTIQVNKSCNIRCELNSVYSGSTMLSNCAY